MTFIFIALFCVFIFLFYYRYPILFKHWTPQKFSVGFGKMYAIGDDIKISNVLSYNEIGELCQVDYIADPFWWKVNDTYYLFVESAINNFGRIDVLESADLNSWKYKGIALQEDFHLSYPQIILYKDELYMIPESKNGGKISLYKTNNFPLNWTEERVLLEGKYLDSTIIEQNDFVYLFAVDRDYKLYCFVSADLIKGNFIEHPMSPLGKGEKMRPAGRPIKINNHWILPVQSRRKGYGYSIASLVIKEISPEYIKYKKGRSLVHPLKDEKYFSHGVHHIDIQKDSESYTFALDGRVGEKVSYWRWYGKVAFENITGDIYSFYRIFWNNMKSKKYKL